MNAYDFRNRAHRNEVCEWLALEGYAVEYVAETVALSSAPSEAVERIERDLDYFAAPLPEEAR